MPFLFLSRIIPIDPSSGKSSASSFEVSVERTASSKPTNDHYVVSSSFRPARTSSASSVELSRNASATGTASRVTEETDHNDSHAVVLREHLRLADQLGPSLEDLFVHGRGPPPRIPPGPLGLRAFPAGSRESLAGHISGYWEGPVHEDSFFVSLGYENEAISADTSVVQLMKRGLSWMGRKFISRVMKNIVVRAKIVFTEDSMSVDGINNLIVWRGKEVPILCTQFECVRSGESNPGGRREQGWDADSVPGKLGCPLAESHMGRVSRAQRTTTESGQILDRSLDPEVFPSAGIAEDSRAVFLVLLGLLFDAAVVGDTNVAEVNERLRPLGWIQSEKSPPRHPFFGDSQLFWRFASADFGLVVLVYPEKNLFRVGETWPASRESPENGRGPSDSSESFIAMRMRSYSVADGSLFIDAGAFMGAGRSRT